MTAAEVDGRERGALRRGRPRTGRVSGEQHRLRPGGHILSLARRGRRSPDAWRAEPQAQVSLTPGTYTLTFVVRTRAENDTLHFCFSSLTGICGAFGPVPNPVPDPGE